MSQSHELVARLVEPLQLDAIPVDRPGFKRPKTGVLTWIRRS